jgi:hypothetical protein
MLFLPQERLRGMAMSSITAKLDSSPVEAGNSKSEQGIWRG